MIEWGMKGQEEGRGTGGEGGEKWAWDGCREGWGEGMLVRVKVGMCVEVREWSVLREGGE